LQHASLPGRGGASGRQGRHFRGIETDYAVFRRARAFQGGVFLTLPENFQLRACARFADPAGAEFGAIRIGESTG
jgi:hypothetical protein